MKIWMRILKAKNLQKSFIRFGASSTFSASFGYFRTVFLVRVDDDV